MSQPKAKWSHNDLVSRIRYALNGPGYSAADAYWAHVVEIDPAWPQPSSPLLCLPPELRNQIYGYLNEPEISHASLTLPPSDKDSSPSPPPPRPRRYLPSVCRQLYLETTSLSYTFHFHRTWHAPSSLRQFTGLASVRWMISTSAAFCPMPDYPGAHELRVWAFGIHFPPGKEVFLDLERVYFRLVVEKTWVDGLVKSGVLGGCDRGDFKGVKEVWESEILKYVALVGRRVEIVFEYEWVDGRWFAVDGCEEGEDADNGE